MWVTFPISYPIALLLDKVMGPQEHQRFSTDELQNLIQLHTKQALEKLSSEEVEMPEDVSGLDSL